jgi:hypothetical protein
MRLYIWQAPSFNLSGFLSLSPVLLNNSVLKALDGEEVWSQSSVPDPQWVNLTYGGGRHDQVSVQVVCEISWGESEPEQEEKDDHM